MVTVHIENPVRERYGGQTTFIVRRSREALREMLQGVLAALDRVRPRDQFEEPRAEEFFEPPTFEQPREPWLPRLPSDVA